MKNEYLQAMGITCWRLRTHSYNLLSADQKIIGTLIAKVNSAREQELLEAIRRALNVTTQIGSSDGSTPLLILGKEITSSASANNSINTHSLAEMLENPKLKSAVWKDIKNFMNSLN